MSNFLNCLAILLGVYLNLSWCMVFSPPGTMRAFPDISCPAEPKPSEDSVINAQSSKPFKTYSSWSLRAWLALNHCLGSLGFDEILCKLAGADADPAAREAAAQKIRIYSPTGRVPALVDETLGITVYESLAIILHLADRFPAAGLLPRDPAARAACLSACAEMHAGFAALRAHLPFHAAAFSATRHGAAALARDDVRRDVDRVAALWTHLRSRYAAPAAGPFLFGSFSAADCMFAPVALRLRLYDPPLSCLPAPAADYAVAVAAVPAVREWVAAARAEGPDLRVPAYDAVLDPLPDPPH